MDFIEGLPRSKGVDTVLVVVDRFTKAAHFLALTHPFSTLTVAELFLKEVIKLHGFPALIISDRDKIFMSNFWRELFRLHGTQLRRSTAYHPQTDVQSEIVNNALETYLRCFINGKPRTWARWLAWAEFSCNTLGAAKRRGVILDFHLKEERGRMMRWKGLLWRITLGTRILL